MIVYAFTYNECHHESAPETISVHFKKCNAWRALQKYKLKLYIERREIVLQYGQHSLGRKGSKYFQSWEDFEIKEVEILP